MSWFAVIPVTSPNEGNTERWQFEIYDKQDEKQTALENWVVTYNKLWILTVFGWQLQILGFGKLANAY